MNRIAAIPLLALTLFLGACSREAPSGPEAATPAGYQPIVLESTLDPALPAPGHEATATDPDDPILRAARGRALADVALADNPVVYWNEYTRVLGAGVPLPPPLFARAYTLVSVGLYDGLVAGNDRRRGNFPPNAVAAGVAYEVLTYLFPARAEQIAADAALEAGITPGNGRAIGGWNLGRAVGRKMVRHGRNDGSDAAFTGTFPTGDGIWTGTNPVLPACGTWRTWVLDAGSEFTPPVPYAYGSPEDLAELDAVYQASLVRTPAQIAAVHKWADRAPPVIWNTSYINPRILSYDLDLIESARVSAFANIAMADAFINCWDCKYRFWTARPIQRIPGLVTVVPTPNFPSYTSGHSTISAAVAVVLGDVFPAEADYFAAEAEEAALSRLWGGIHFPQDNIVGGDIGRQIGRKVADRMTAGAPAPTALAAFVR